VAEHTDSWGALTEILRELEPAVTLLASKPPSAPALRVHVRWIFAAAEAFNFCLKRIVVEHLARTTIELSRREREVLEMIKEPSFPGLPPPRRINTGMRESLGVAVNVYAKVRKKESPLVDGRLPQIFIDATCLHDRITHPECPDDLRLTKEDLATVVEFQRWFETIRSWLYKDRADEIEEMKARMNASFDALRRKILDSDKPSSG
jgi:hypothetical protein